MRFLLTGKCLCGAPFQKDNQLKDVVLNETNHISLQCHICKAYLRIETHWIKADERRTIAQKIDGKIVDEVKIEGSVQFNPTTLIHTFDDMSQAKIISRSENLPIEKAFMTKSLTTSTRKEVKYWMAL